MSEGHAADFSPDFGTEDHDTSGSVGNPSQQGTGENPVDSLETVYHSLLSNPEIRLSPAAKAVFNAVYQRLLADEQAGQAPPGHTHILRTVHTCLLIEGKEIDLPPATSDAIELIYQRLMAGTQEEPLSPLAMHVLERAYQDFLGSQEALRVAGGATQPEPFVSSQASTLPSFSLTTQRLDGPSAPREQAKKAGEKRRFSSVLVINILILSLACIVVGVGLYLWARERGGIPTAIANLVTRRAGSAAAPTLDGQGAGAADSASAPTATVTAGMLLEPTRATPTEQTPLMTGTPFPQPGSATATASVDGPTPTTTPTQQLTPSPVATSLPTPTLPSDIAVTDMGITQAGVSMIHVPGGKFAMGSSVGDLAQPVHDVTLAPYYIDQYEVTNDRWAACVAAGGCSPPTKTTSDDGRPYYGVDAFGNYPVIYINWLEADAYCRWRGARLPTEAEWEMAARWDPDTNEVSEYPWGNGWDPERLNYCDSGCYLTDQADLSYDDGFAQTAPVGSFPAGVSPLGIHDMVGNVAEWVADWFASDYYHVSPAENPAGPASGDQRVVRGGAWGVSLPELLRSTTRSRFVPTERGSGVGFRCALLASDIEPYLP